MAACLACPVAVPQLAAADPDNSQTAETEQDATAELQTDPEASEDPGESTSEDESISTSEDKTDKPDKTSKDATSNSGSKGKAKTSNKGKKDIFVSPDSGESEEETDTTVSKRMSEKDVSSAISSAYSYSQQAQDALYALGALAKEFPAYTKAVDKAHKASMKANKKLKKFKKKTKKLDNKIERAQEVIDAAQKELTASEGADLVSVVAGRATFDDIDSKAYLLDKTIADREAAIAASQVAQGARIPAAKLATQKLKKAKKREKRAIRQAGTKASELEQRVAEVRKYDRLAAEAADSATKYSSRAKDALAAVTQTAAAHESELSDTTDMLLTWYTSANAASGIDAHQEITGIALSYLGVKYVWGGETPEGGFDCSGLTMYCYAKIGKPLTHFAQTQYSEGRHIEKNALMPGDLVFFGTGMDDISHVGIYLGNDEFVHAPHEGDVVKVSKLSERTNYVAACRP